MYTNNITDKKTHYGEDGRVTTTYTFEFEFKTKKEYLEFRKGWKEHYLELSKRIRVAKLDIKNKMREQAKDHATDDPSDYWYYNVWKEEGHKLSLKEQARMMMQLVEAAKKEAGRQQRLELDKKLQKAS